MGVTLADDLLEDARQLAAKGAAQNRGSSMRRAISTAYYAVFHLLVGISSNIGIWNLSARASPGCLPIKRCGTRPSLR
jgi:hypothetical protein